MTSRQWRIAAVVVASLAIVVGAVVALVASGGDEHEAVRVETSTTVSTTTPSASTLPSTSAPVVTAPSVTTAATITPGTTRVVPTAPPPMTPRTATTTTATTRTTATTATPSIPTTTRPGAAAEVGITADEIRLAVIADEPATVEGVAAWRTHANRIRVAGRKIQLDVLSTDGSTDGYARAVRTACDRDFAIVGSLSQLDEATGAAGCGAIPDIPVEAVNAGRSAAPNTYAAFPRRPGTVAVGAFTWILANIDGCCSQFWAVPSTGAERARASATIDGAAKAGFTTAGTGDVAPNAPSSRYDELAHDILDTHATFAASGLGSDSSISLRRAANAAGVSQVKAWYCDARCYGSSFLADGGRDVEGQIVSIETLPFAERADVAALRSYFRSARSNGDAPSYEGLRGYVAGLLFEQAAGRVARQQGRAALTRASLLDVLAGIHDFSAGGIIGTTDVAARTPNGCFVVLEVHNGRFVRRDPAGKGELDCGSQHLVDVG